ncbi:DNA gyrase inhibitor YacG [Oceanospirillum sediminis]|uniref:DNA gyrase inhibitor YacG n=1 Tax=Oceanospirillum sediminis TaxID=2760088 RepID=A0A839ILU4_9GAMM|nr:DNA gyrase inhibitor YacG [Oceanospirillum sediminis]MBB1485469.1 DNA gyrase inhibitor YacG [Oceanospirillum sediminis]
MSQKTLTVNCPTCRCQIEWKPENQHRPFCSERCRLIDLGEWASESHKIAGEPALDEASSDLMENLYR